MFKKILFLLLLPSAICHPVAVFAVAPGDVVINEIMWMGTAASSSDEWIELYNNTDYDVAVSSWVLKSEDGVPNIVLSGVVKAKGYYLLERTDDNTVKGQAADKIYSGALSDTGENLVLCDSYTVTMDSVPCVSGWFAGAKSPYYSMERINPRNSGWLKTNWSNNNGVIINGLDANGGALFATPKAQNSVYYEGDPGDEQDPGNPAAEYKIKITEVAFASSTDWVELYNYGSSPVDIAGFMLTDLDGTDSRLADKTVTLAPGKYAVVYWDEAGVDETDEAGDLNNNGIIDLYIPDTGLSSTTDQVVLMSANGGGQFIDAVCWSDGAGEFASGEDKDVALLAAYDQWRISGSTVTKSDCWTDSSKILPEQSLGRLSATADDTNSKNDWFIFKGPSPGLMNPSLVPPVITLLFDPPPPFMAGQVKVSLQIETLNAITAPPVLSFSEGSGKYQEIILSGANKDWAGVMQISQDETDRLISFKCQVADSAKNTLEQEIAYMGLAYVPPVYGENMYCFPNPWLVSSGQRLAFTALGDEEATIRIYSLAGEKVQTLSGSQQVLWDGTNSNGSRIASGIYLYVMENSRTLKKGKFAVYK